MHQQHETAKNLTDLNSMATPEQLNMLGLNLSTVQNLPSVKKKVSNQNSFQMQR